MNLTSRSRYGLKVMLDFALHHGEPHVNRQDVADRQGIPASYLDKIIQRLRRAGLLESVRGRGGGYRLTRPPDEISAWQVFAAVEDSMLPVECLEEVPSCQHEASCLAAPAWEVIFFALRGRLESLKISDLIHLGQPARRPCGSGGVQECRGGRGHGQVALKTCERG